MEKDFNKGINRLTLNARKYINKGSEISKEYKYTQFGALQLFFSLISDVGGITFEVLNKLGVDIESTKARIQTEMVMNLQLNTVKPVAKDIKFSEELKNIINESFVVSFDLDHVYVGSEHLLLAMFKLQVDFVKEFNTLGINFETVKNTLLSIATYPNFSQLPKGMGPESQSVMPFFARSMNEQADMGEFSQISGRDKEIDRLIHILARKSKNNPILVGEAGVGKTAVVEGFINRIVARKVPASFLNKKVLNLDIASILSGAKLRGDVEERITGVINEAIAEGNTIIFIDEIHMIVGAGSAGARDSLDIANILKPYLTSGSLSVIGATTHDEYTKYFETDPALTRRFQPIYVNELSIESAKEVIRKVVPEFEDYHNIKIQPEAVDIAVELSAKFIQDRYLPDKALDLLDEASASVKIGREVAMEPELNKLGNTLIDIQAKKDGALKKSDFKLAAKYKEEEEKLIDQIEDTIEGRAKVEKRASKTVSVDLIESIVVEWTGIPIAASDISDKRLKDLTKRLEKRIIGQDRIVENVSLAIQRSHLGLGGENKPLASFLFLGPTGVGKTELAKTLARELFGSEDLMYQINMSEYMEMHSSAKLIGSPPGYVGYQEGGQLTTFVKRKPYSVILFDEIEKAHPDTLNLLLQVLDEGMLTDGKGMKVSLKNCIIIMTSNIGAREVASDSKLGFDINLGDKEEEQLNAAYTDMKDKIMEELRLNLRPELLNRIDVIDIFKGLNKKDCREITQVLVDELKKRLIKQGIVLEVASEVVDFINEEGYSKEYGARNLKRKIQEQIENKLAEFLLNTKLPKKRKTVVIVNVGMKDKDVTFSLN
ncbi:MAG: ATP-dependent Clp protease ATP-binding subunit [Candidatus Dojkabacteria bacterium]